LIDALWEALVFYFQLAFIIGRTQCHSPSLFLANLVLRRLTDEEIAARQSASPPLKTALVAKK